MQQTLIEHVLRARPMIDSRSRWRQKEQISSLLELVTGQMVHSCVLGWHYLHEALLAYLEVKGSHGTFQTAALNTTLPSSHSHCPCSLSQTLKLSPATNNLALRPLHGRHLC